MNERRKEKPPLWERIVALAGLLIVAGLLGYLGYDALSGDGKPPVIAVEIKEITANGGGYLVQFEVTNKGDQTAAGVMITGELRRFGVTLESAQAEITYIPTRSTRRGGLFFTRDPRDHELELRPVGYAQP